MLWQKISKKFLLNCNHFLHAAVTASKQLIMEPEILVAILVPIAGMAMIFGIVYLFKKENLAMIEKGMNPKVYRPAPYTSLKYGLLLMGSGMGLLLAYLIDIASPTIDGDENPAIYFALIAIFGGLGLVLSYRIEKKEVLDKNIE
jgi:hypothetical protein